MDMVSALSIAVGGGAVLVSALIGSRALWRIANRKHADEQIRQIKDRADAHRRLWYALRQIDADGKRERGERGESLETWYARNVVDNEWLRNYFRDKAVLLAPELYEAYIGALDTAISMREKIRRNLGEDTDMRVMAGIAKREMEEYDRLCADKIKEYDRRYGSGFNPLKRGTVKR